MEIAHISAFAIEQGVGGNPAGVALLDAFPSDDAMQAKAAEIGYSESVFAVRLPDGVWRVRYFAPASEVAFCGHATIALGAALAKRFGAGMYQLRTNDSEVAVTAAQNGAHFDVRLRSPATSSRAMIDSETDEILAFLGWGRGALNSDFAPAIGYTSEAHPILMLDTRARLAALDYDFEAAHKVMLTRDYCTVMLVYQESDERFHARNVFASGGVIEDPATGSAAAAFARLLRDRGYETGRQIEILQGEDMGMPSKLIAEIPDEGRAPVNVGGIAYEFSP